MKPAVVLKHQFVESLPDVLEEKTLYVCMEFATAAHKCGCGCGKEVVTPLSPTDWKLMYDGKTITLHPSIGNWGFPCRSHYWIRNNRIQWAEQWSQERVEAGRAHDRFEKENYFGLEKNKPVNSGEVTATTSNEKQGIWQRVKQWWS